MQHARRSAMTQARTLYVGMDVQKASIAVAYGVQDHGAEVVSRGHSGTRQCDLDTLLRRLPSQSPPLVFVAAAGPCGSWLSRDRTNQGHVCWGVAPSWLPTQPGDRGNTTRRDALQRARLRRSGALPPVSGPAVAAAAMRALCRAREDAIREVKTAKVRLQALLLRPESRDTGRAPWGPAHLR